ncbi:MAG: hypothetical protein U0166_29190 [Acidobacteriota bacterium]
MPVVSVGLVAYGLFVRHGEVVNVEAMGVLHARRFASHEPVYRSWQHFPHAVAPYGPANYAVPGLLTRWLGLSIQGTFLAMRSVSLVAFTLLVAIILVTVAPRAGAAGAAACAALLVGADVMTQFAVCGRPDLASLCLQAAGLAILDRRRGTVATALLAAPFLLLACSFKQVAVIATIAAAAWLAASDRAGWRPAIALLAAVLAPLLGLAAIGEYATGGALLENTVASQAFPHGIAMAIALLPAVVLPVAPRFSWQACRAHRRLRGVPHGTVRRLLRQRGLVQGSPAPTAPGAGSTTSSRSPSRGASRLDASFAPPRV